MYNIYCLQGFNNYYNRIVKKFNNINEYLNYQIEDNKEYLIFSQINFVPNDCVNTNQILNWSKGWLPDYFIVENADTGDIMRWFVVESVRQRGQQYAFQLRRDLFVDFYDSVMDAPCFVEKANLLYDNPLIFNKEDIGVNQIKQSETLLMDETECPWLVGYYSKGATLEGTVDINTDPEAVAINVQNITAWNFYKYTNESMIGPQSYGEYTFKYADGSAINPSYFQIKVNEKDGSASRSYTTAASVQIQHTGTLLSESDFKNVFINFGLGNLNASSYSGVVSQSLVNELLSFNGKLIKTLDGKYYRISTSSFQKTTTIPIQSGALFNGLKSIITNLGFIGSPNTETFKYTFTAQYYDLSIVEEINLSTKYNITTDRLITTDAPWDIFAIPYGEITVNSNGSMLVKTSKDYGIATAMSMQANKATIIHDIQLVPYCPVQSLIKGKKTIEVSDSKEYTLIKSGNNETLGIIFNVPKSTFDFNITGNTIKLAQNGIERKLNAECDKWRLTSPNYSNYFDFSVEKNGGITYFNVDVNYKPYSPYIHVNPNFGYLYGYDDNSPRGLILGGDFSLSQIINQWEQYQIQNKNFQNIFDRQVQNLDLTQSIQRTQDIVKAITGTATGGATGAFTGSLFGGYGAAIGAAVGTVASGAGGVADYMLNEKLRNETLDYKLDMFGYQLGNIQALPNTISKVSALNNNNKIFPVLEYYSCTNTEKIAVLNKLAYNGMTVMTIGKLRDYEGFGWSYTIFDDLKNENITITSKNYIKGRLIKIEDINCDDFHVANEISSEVFKGVYL